MIVEKKDNGDLAAYCFRCGSSGFAPAGRLVGKALAEAGKAAARKRDASAEEREHPELRDDARGRKRKAPPADATANFADFGQLAKVWLLGKARIPKNVASEYGFLWDETKQELWIPVKQMGVNRGWQVRCFEENGRKYDTITEDGSMFFGHHMVMEGSSDTVVIVEDVLSALRCSKFHDSIALLGVFLKPSMVQAISDRGYKNAIVFLDGDNTQVKLAARKIALRLPFLRTRIVETGQDPKKHSDEELSCLI